MGRRQLPPPPTAFSREGGRWEAGEGGGVQGFGSWRAGSIFVMLGSEWDTVQTSSPCIRARPVRGCPRPVSQLTSRAQHALSSLNQGPHAEGPSQLPNPKLSSRKQLCKQLVSQIGRRERATGQGWGGVGWGFYDPTVPPKRPPPPLGGRISGVPTSPPCPAAAWMKERTSPGAIHFCGESGRARRQAARAPGLGVEGVAATEDWGSPLTTTP